MINEIRTLNIDSGLLSACLSPFPQNRLNAFQEQVSTVQGLPSNEGYNKLTISEYIYLHIGPIVDRLFQSRLKAFHKRGIVRIEHFNGGLPC